MSAGEKKGHGGGAKEEGSSTASSHSSTSATTSVASRSTTDERIRITLANNAAAGDMEQDDLNDFFHVAASGEIWRCEEDPPHSAFEILGPLGMGTFGRVLLVRSLSQPSDKKEEESRLYAIKMNLKSSSELSAEEAVKAGQQITSLEEYLTTDLPEGLVRTHMLEKALPALKRRIEDASPPPTDLRLFDGNIVRRAHAEKEILLSMNHPFINRLRGVYEDAERAPGRVFMLLDFIPGGTLKFHLASAPDGHFEEEVARFYAAELVVALEYLSRPEVNVSHRDLKPENIMLDEEGHLCVMDFGLATRLKGSKVKTFCGTAEYLAPEVLSEQSWDKDTLDWWSFAVVLYEMLTGKTPFEAGSAREVFLNILMFEGLLAFPPSFPKDAEDLVRLILQRDPKVKGRNFRHRERQRDRERERERH